MLYASCAKLNAASGRAQNDGTATDDEDGEAAALAVLGPGLEDRLAALRDGASAPSSCRGARKNDAAAAIEAALRETCLICRPCHDAVHRTFPCWPDLALEKNTVGKLLEDDRIRSFCRWNSKRGTRNGCRVVSAGKRRAKIKRR